MSTQHTKHLTTLDALTRHIAQTNTSEDWPEDWLLEQSADKIRQNFGHNMGALQNKAAFIFTEIDNINQATTRNAGLLDDWHSSDAPSLYALTCYALDTLTPNAAPDLYQAALTSALLGSVTSALPYHNNLHYAKVLIQTLRLACAHNHIFQGTADALAHDDIVWLIIAACLHDIGHDGTGNTVRGIHKPSHLEQRSLNIALPRLTALGFDAASPEITRLCAMIIATDVTPIDDPASPARQMKAAYRAHMISAHDSNAPLNLDPALSVLEHDKKASLMALLLHEADLATSSGLTYAITARETILIHKEQNLPPPRPQHIVNFLKHICQRKVLSDAGQKIYAANLARIYAQAQHETDNGNEKLTITCTAPSSKHTQEKTKTTSPDQDDAIN